jgi:hypothetical protein
MLESGLRLRLIAAVTVGAVLTAACGVGSTTTPSATDSPTMKATGTARATASTALATAEVPSSTGTTYAFSGRVVALAESQNGEMGLWVLGADARWIEAATVRGASALGTAPGGLAVVTPAGIDVRSYADVSRPGTVASVKWATGMPSAPVGGLDFSPSGRIAVVAADDVGLRYAVARADGVLETLSAAPAQTFTPLVRWLDDTRLLVLSTDDQQVSRLAVVDTGAHTLRPKRAIAGVRYFALSGDRQIVAAATDNAVYVMPAAALDGANTPGPIATIADSQVVWALALDMSGGILLMLAGPPAADGSMGAVEEVVYRLRGSTWTKVVEMPVPFGRAVAQVYLS